MRKSLPVFLLLFALAFSVFQHTAFGFGTGAEGPDVYAVQGMMKSLGYYAGKIDGVYGPITASGVKEFQRKYALPITGNVDGRTLQSILWAYGELKIPKQKTPAPTEPPAKQPSPTPPPNISGLSAEEQEMVNLVNGERIKRGITALKVNLDLAKTARLKSQDMVANNYFSHQSPTYGSPFEMMQKFGISFTAAAENIACNQSVAAAHQALMNSEGHRENILNPTYTEIGVGIVDGGPCGKMFTQQFIAK